MREIFFNERGVRWLAASLRAVSPGFDEQGFVQAILPRFPDLGLNERNAVIRDTLRSQLPQDYPTAVKILLQAMGPERAPEGPDSYDGFIVMSLCAFVAEYGLEHQSLSLRALKEMTKRFSAEFAIRPFLDRDPDGVLKVVHQWARDRHPQVRRLASEGTRPRLPWGMRLQKFVKDPRPVLEVLELLKEDPELFVRRSVANNINDIAKDHPELVVKTLDRWKKSANKETQWLVKHALRTLLKQGHPEALELLGFQHGARVELSGLKLSASTVRVGEALEFGFCIRSSSSKAQALMIDYAIHYRKANGEQKPKVFKLKTLTLAPGARVEVGKKQSFRPIGIRPFYPGPHAVEILVNGQAMGKARFELVMAAP